MVMVCKWLQRKFDKNTFVGSRNLPCSLDEYTEKWNNLLLYQINILKLLSIYKYLVPMPIFDVKMCSDFPYIFCTNIMKISYMIPNLDGWFNDSHQRLLLSGYLHALLTQRPM